ncbi:STAM-binding protein-like A [Fopius arisanus]|uniref:STAM-binding protein-like A n=2 Tax=Braconidae TaxID=7402 RepID=A0A9R1TEB6_9HYME|nr:PREDICTED: STAM-binding protein-like A [Fopius arisanus]XP_011307551.1 PREDICTED: STAM-binding protein-like A [Fopius arisanus]
MSRERDKSANTKHISKEDVSITDPASRLKYITELYSAVEINPNYAAIRYYRTGIDMTKMAAVYLKEGSLESAYALYMKFLTIFLEKIMNHPQYNTVPAAEKAKNTAMLKKIIPVAEELKKKLLEQYKQDAAIAIEKLKQQKHEEEERLRVSELEEKTPRLRSADFSGDFDRLDRLDRVAPSTADDTNLPVFDRSLKPSTYPSPKSGLRQMSMPSRMMTEFLKLSRGNTANNKETCGILAGSLVRNQLFVTHLLIPQQMGSSDSCVTHNEEDIFDYQDQHSLITLGWIHTHPTQTAFLSSVDLHTHCAYQLMMAEAIAVVCAPKYEETGFFMLTPDHGLNFIARCRATGFHPHPNEKSLYTHADHCKLDATANVTVVDLRKTT